MPYNYEVYRRILHEVQMRLPNFKPLSALDFGAGLGSGAWACNHIFQDHGLARVAAVEPNMAMRKLGKFLT